MAYDSVNRIIAQRETVTHSTDGQSVSVDNIQCICICINRAVPRWLTTVLTASLPRERPSHTAPMASPCQ